MWYITVVQGKELGTRFNSPALHRSGYIQVMEGQQGGEGVGRMMKENRNRERGSRRESGRRAKKRKGVRVNAPSSSQGCFLVILCILLTLFCIKT